MIKWKMGMIYSGFLGNGQHLSVFVDANNIQTITTQMIYKFKDEFHHISQDNSGGRCSGRSDSLHIALTFHCCLFLTLGKYLLYNNLIH